MTSPRFISSTLGRKVVMAVTGVILFGFVLAHMVGNLLLYSGPAALNAYAESLRRVPAALWGARAVLLIAVLLHIWAAIVITLANRAARPHGYARRKDLAATYASRTMVWSGPLLAVFIVYHLLHFTTGNVHGSFVPGDVYHNVVTGFRNPLISGFYIVAMIALGLHLYHGLYSMTSSVGLSHPQINPYRRPFAAVVTAVIVAANISFPVAVMAGLVRAQAPVEAHLARIIHEIPSRDAGDGSRGGQAQRRARRRSVSYVDEARSEHARRRRRIVRRSRNSHELSGLEASR